MLPRGGDGHSRKTGKRLILSVEPGRNRVILERGGQTETLAELANLDAGSLAEMARLAKRHKRYPLGLRLGGGNCFARTVDLPAQAEGDYGRILDLDMERTTPFRSADVLSVYYPASGVTAPRGRKAVRHMIVKRRTVEPIIAELRQCGIEPAFADCWDEEGRNGVPVDFLAGPRAAASGRGGFAAGFAIIATVLAVSAVAILFIRHQQALAALTERAAQSRIEAARVRQTAEAAQAVSGQIAAMQRLIRDRVPLARVIEELTAILPDSAWIADLRIDGGRVEFTGFSQSAASLVPLLEQSPLFTDASLTSPVVLDDNEDKERFSLRLHLAGYGQSGTQIKTDDQ